MPRMYRVAHVHNVLAFLYVSVAFVAHESSTFGLLLSIAALAESTTGILHKPGISKSCIT